MNDEDFAASPVGHLRSISGTDAFGRHYRASAFAPRPLGPPPELSTPTWTRIASASRALGRLQQGLIGVDPSLLRAPTIRREAQSTSALEGTYAPLEDVLAGGLVAPDDRSSALNEVLNYVEAANDGFAWAETARPLTMGLLTDLHRTLVRGTSADTEQAGRIRSIQVVIGGRSAAIEDARSIPMPPGPELEVGLRDLLDWIRESRLHDPLVAAAMAHYQFEALHPFNDGNGRIGRLLIVLQLVGRGVLEEGLLSVSPWFERRRDRYQELLAFVSMTGSWDTWIDFFVEGIEASAIDTAERLRALVALQHDFRARIRSTGGRGAIIDIADLLIGTPFVSIPSVSSALGVTYQAASNAIGKLVELGILVQRPGGRVMTFRAPEVVEIVSAPASADGLRS